MTCVVCTLFERDYHFGVAVLVNSLCASGFKGTVYAGFRGPLPPWAESASSSTPERWELTVTPEVRIVFSRLETSAHFSNYKPDFLFRVKELAESTSDAVVYFDPDLVVNSRWSYLEEWLSCGVALCEDVNSPLAENHPRRVGWRRFFEPTGSRLTYRGEPYANGGMIGLRWSDSHFLTVWQKFLSQVCASLGGNDVVDIGGGRVLRRPYGFANCFGQPDQDSLNAALEACPDIAVSFLGRQAMGFQSGNPLLPHALGPMKPWNRNYLRDALMGISPGPVDKVFWRNADGPIKPYPPVELRIRQLAMKVGAALGRVIRRG